MASRIPLYVDFEAGQIVAFADNDTMPVGNQFQFPVGYVVSNTTNTDPNTDLGYGAWDYVGSQTIGAATVYYYERVVVP